MISVCGMFKQMLTTFARFYMQLCNSVYPGVH